MPPDETETVPPIPAHLRGRESLYGYTVAGELTLKGSTVPSILPARTFIKALAIFFRVEIDHMDGQDDILWFVYTRYR
jgi:hypothetical protein